jgi:hypothetical protein
MRRRVALTVGLVASAVLLAALASTGSADHPGSQTLTFVERNAQGTFKYIDHPPKAPRRSERVSPGDTLLGHNALYDASNTRRVGRLFFKCTAIRGARRFQRATFICEVTIRVANGTLVGSAAVNFGTPVAGAIIGGSGAYEGASGGFAIDERRRTSVDTLHFDTE